MYIYILYIYIYIYIYMLTLSALCVGCQISILNTTKHFFKNNDVSSLTNLQQTVTNKNVKKYILPR